MTIELTDETLEKYRKAVTNSPAWGLAHEEAEGKDVRFQDFLDSYILNKLEKELPFFMQEYAYGDEPNQKVEIRYGPYITEVTMRDRDGDVRFINRVETDILLPSNEEVDIVSCLVLTQALNYLLDLQDEEHDAARVCKEASQGD